GMRMRRRDREVPKDELQPIAHRLLYVLDDRIRSSAVGAFVVAVLEQCDRRVRRPLNVIAAFGDGHREARLPDRSHFGSSSSAFRIPSAPGFIPTGET